MGQKTNPISNRIGITRGWDSNWVGGNYAEKIAEDFEIRKYLSSRLAKASLSKIVIERTLKLITVTIHAARPGVIIGKGGQAVDLLKEELKKVTKKDVQINIFEVKKPEVDAHIVADSIARQIEGRVSYRRAIKMAIASAMRVGAEGIKVQINIYEVKKSEVDATIVADSIARQIEGRVSYRRAIKMAIASAMRVGAEGIKVQVSGRLGGAEMARSEMIKEGRTPLHTFRADIDYALAEAHTKVGVLGIKVWICNGEVYGKKDLSPNAGVAAQAQQSGNNNRGGRGNDRRRGGRNNRRDNK